MGRRVFEKEDVAGVLYLVGRKDYVEIVCGWDREHGDVSSDGCSNRLMKEIVKKNPVAGRDCV